MEETRLGEEEKEEEKEEAVPDRKYGLELGLLGSEGLFNIISEEKQMRRLRIRILIR